MANTVAPGQSLGRAVLHPRLRGRKRPHVYRQAAPRNVWCKPRDQVVLLVIAGWRKHVSSRCGPHPVTHPGCGSRGDTVPPSWRVMLVLPRRRTGYAGGVGEGRWVDVGSVQAQAGPLAQLLKPTARISSALLLISLIGWHKVAHLLKQTAHLSSALLLTRRHKLLISCWHGC